MRSMSGRTFRVLDLLQALAQCRTVLELEAGFVGGDGVVISAQSMEGCTFPRVALRPCGIDLDALRRRVSS